MNNKEIVDYIKKSFELKNQGFYKPAIEMLYKALSIDSDNIEILAQLAQLYKLLGNNERAESYIEKVLELNPLHLDSLLLLKELCLLQDKFLPAKDIAQKIFEIQPSAKNLAEKIKILNKLNDFEEIKKIENSIEDLNDEVLYEIAFSYKENYDFDKAIELLEKTLELNNQNTNAMNLLAEIYFEKNDFKKSKDLFLKLEKIIPSAKTINYLGLFELNEQRFSKAIQLFSKANSLDATNAEYLYNLASAYFLNGWLDEALKFFNQAICLDPENVNYHFSLAYLYYHKKLYDKALSEIKFVKTQDQHHQPSNVLNALIIYKIGDACEAKNQLEKIIKTDADDFAYYALSEVLKEFNQLEQSKEKLLKAIELKPNSISYLADLAETEFVLRNLGGAEKLIEKILEINPKYLSAHVLQARINFEKKDYASLYESAQEIIELDSNCAEGYYYNAIALFEQGDKDFAIESLKKSISLDLNNASLYIKMSEFYQDLGDFKYAYEWAKEASGLDERNYKYKWLCAKLAATLKQKDEAIKHYSQSYRLAALDPDLAEDYSNYLKSIGKEKQAKKILK